MDRKEIEEFRNRFLNKKKSCKHCGETFVKAYYVEIDCGLHVEVYEHDTWICPNKEDRVPYVYR